METVNSRIKNQLLETGKLKSPENKPIMIFHLTDKDEHAIPDLEIINWADRVLKAINEDFSKGIKEHDIFCSNSLAFDRFRKLFKDGHFTNLLYEENNVIYDIVLPNGTMVGSDLPDDCLLGKEIQKVIWSM